MVWAEMVMGRNGHGPIWLWAEMTSDLPHKMGSPFLAHLSRRLKGELIVYRSIRCPCVRASVGPWVNIFKLEYLRNQWANRNQILSEASLGGGLIALGFGPGRIGTLVSMATDSSHRVIMGKMLCPL